MKKLLPLIAAVTLTACGTPEEPWTRERQEQVTRTTFPNSRPDTALRLAERVLKLSDPRSISFEYGNNSLTAKRRVFAYFIIAAINGNYRFTINAQPYQGGSNVEIKAYSELAAITATGPHGAEQGGTFITSEGVYKLFFDRMKFLSGNSDHWVTCDEAPEKYGLPEHHFESLCFEADDNNPG